LPIVLFHRCAIL